MSANRVQPQRFINVKDQFGAVGNGSANDVTALQAALDAYDPTVGVPDPNAVWSAGIFLPRGRYLHSAPLQLKPGTRIYGEALGGTQLVYTGSDEEAGNIQLTGTSDSYCSDVTIENITFDNVAGSGIYVAGSSDLAMAFTFTSSVWTDRTTAARQYYAATFPILPTAGTDYFYFGSLTTFASFHAIFTTLLSGAVFAAEYWNGAWTALTFSESQISSGTDINLYWTAPGDWVTTTANAITSGTITDTQNCFYIRIRATTASAQGALNTLLAFKTPLNLLGLKIRNCVFSTNKTSIQLGKGYAQRCDIWHNQWRDGGGDLLFLWGNQNDITANNRETGFRAGGAAHQAAVRCIGGRNHISRNLIEGGGTTMAYWISGAETHFLGNWHEGFTDASGYAYRFDYLDIGRIDDLLVQRGSAIAAKVYFNHCKGLVIDRLRNELDERWSDPITLQSTSIDPETLIIVNQVFSKRYDASPDRRLYVRSLYSNRDQRGTSLVHVPRSGNLVVNGDMQTGMEGITVAYQAGVSGNNGVIEDSPSGGKRLKVTITANSGAADYAVSVQMAIATLPTAWASKPGLIQFSVLTDPVIDPATNRPVTLFQYGDTGLTQASASGTVKIPLPNLGASAFASGATLEWRLHVNGATTMTWYLENIGAYVGGDESAGNDIHQRIINPAGIGADWGTASPSTGTYPQGWRRWKTSVAAGGSPGWMATAANTFKQFPRLVDADTTSTNEVTVNTNYANGQRKRISNNANFTMAVPTNKPTTTNEENLLIYEVFNSHASSTITITFTTGSSGAFRYGTDITSSDATVTAQKTKYFGCRFNITDDRWDIISVVEGY